MFSYFSFSKKPEEEQPLLSDVETHDQINVDINALSSPKKILSQLNLYIDLLQQAKSDAAKRRNTIKIFLLLNMLFSAGGIATSLYFLINEWMLESKVSSFGLREWSGPGWICGYYDHGELVRTYHPVCNPSFVPLPECKNGFDKLCALTATLTTWRNEHQKWWLGYPALVVSLGSSFLSAWKGYFLYKNKPTEDVTKLLHKDNLEKLQQLINEVTLISCDLKTEKVNALITKLIEMREKKLLNLNRMYAFLSGSRRPASDVYNFFCKQQGRRSDICSIIYDYLCTENQPRKQETVKSLAPRPLE